MIRRSLKRIAAALHDLPAPAREGTPDPAIILCGVEKTYGEGALAVRALRGIDLEIRRGELVVVVGPSGSGKTTLLNVLGGIEAVSTGSIRVDGSVLETLDDRALTAYRRDRIGFVFQFFNLIPTLTARENVAIVAELVGASAAVVDRSLDQVGLSHRAEHFPGALSGGEQQRVAIARAIAKRPEVLLCDEPTGSLDLETGRQVLVVLRQLNRQAGLTILLVTHNHAIAQMADRVVRMGSGRVEDDRRQALPVEAEAVSW